MPSPPDVGSMAIDIEHLLHERDAARILGLSVAWLQRARWSGTGPPYVKAGGPGGRAVRYKLWAGHGRAAKSGRLGAPRTMTTTPVSPLLRPRTVRFSFTAMRVAARKM